MILECTGIAFIMVNVTCTEVAPPPPVAVCPPVKAWSAQFQKQVAKELRAAPNGALAQVAVQAIGMRKVAQACAAAKRK